MEDQAQEYIEGKTKDLSFSDITISDSVQFPNTISLIVPTSFQTILINLKDSPYNLMIKIHDNALLLIDSEDKFDVELIASPVILAMFILT